MSRAQHAGSDKLDRQINLYSLAAAAAGVSLLALAQPAKGEVIITKKTIPIPVDYRIPVDIDINHDGITDFQFRNSYYSFSGTHLSVAGGGVVGTFYASALARGAKIGPSAHFSSGSGSIGEHIEWGTGGYNNHHFRGKWGDNAKNRYLGIRFLINGETHYGWIRLTVTLPSTPTSFMTATITGYAYETIPNKPILAGTAERETLNSGVQKGEPTLAGPSLGMLALGAEGLDMWKRE